MHSSSHPQHSGIPPTMNRRGDPKSRPERIRTTVQHEQQHMDQSEQYYKIREAAVNLLIHGKCESYEKANQRGRLVETIWNTASSLESYLQLQLEVEDYEDNTSKRNKAREILKRNTKNLIDNIID